MKIKFTQDITLNEGKEGKEKIFFSEGDVCYLVFLNEKEPSEVKLLSCGLFGKHHDPELFEQSISSSSFRELVKSNNIRIIE